MNAQSIGYRQDLFVLPFDHRGSFETGLLGIRGRRPTPQEVERLAAFERIVYDGFLQALDGGVPTDAAAILVDQKYGRELLADARERGIITCVPVEKSGLAEFDFEYGDSFGERLEDAAPTFAKVLVRYNPDGDAGVNETQRRRLRVLSDHVHATGYRLMFELLVPATEGQLESAGRDERAYDLRLRPELAVRAMAEIQTAGIEPDVWKLEGIEDHGAARDLVAQARTKGRDAVGIIILGRGEDEERVASWLATGAQTEGVIGFAVGRTVFWQPLVDHKEGLISRSEAAGRIAETYRRLHELFVGARVGAAAQQDVGR